jgi:hypothetical protein
MRAHLSLFLILAFLAGCGLQGVTHADYGDCARQTRHIHNDTQLGRRADIAHVFLGDYHDHALCEWLKYD